jgi:hypothetical protein
MASTDISDESTTPEVKLVTFTAFSAINDRIAFGIFCHAFTDSSSAAILPATSLSAAATSSAPAPSSIEIPAHILKLLPEKYHAYAEIFRDKEVEQLRPHRPFHDIKIELDEGKSPPFGPIYSLSEAEWKVLKDYLDDVLHRGFIRPSSSPAASPVLFIKKANGSLRLCVDYCGLNSIMK